MKSPLSLFSSFAASTSLGSTASHPGKLGIGILLYSFPLYFFTSLRHLFSVFSKPRQLDSESALYDAAIKILMRRAHSVHEMKQALERRCEDSALVKNVLARLKRSGLMDDARYAKQFARHRTESRKQGRFRIARDLRARGVPDRHIEAALEEAAQQTDEAALVRQRIERKLRSLRGSKPSGHLRVGLNGAQSQMGERGANFDEKKLASLYRSLLRAGFSAEVIRRELRSITRDDVPEVDADSDV